MVAVRLRRTPLLAAALLVLAACGGEPLGKPVESPGFEARSQSDTRTSTSGPTPSQAPSTTPSAQPVETTPPTPNKPRLGVDVSHHKGVVDWKRVAGHGISFAYLKASQGTGFTDPRFASNLSGAKAAGIKAGGYHYFTLCGRGAPQAEHYLRVIGDKTTMPPAVDVEFIGNCSPGPPRDSLVRELRAFIDTVEQRTGTKVVVYLYPEIEEHYRLADELDRRQWVRSLGSKPTRDWWIWQKSDSARIPGISSPADLNQMR